MTGAGRLLVGGVAGTLLAGLCTVLSGSPAVAASAPARVLPTRSECSLERPRLIPEDGPVQNDALVRLLAAASWKHATGKGVVVAVVDSGVQAGNVHFPPGSLLPGYSNVPGYPNPQESISMHGTVVAGLVAARRVEGSGVVGLAPDAKVMPVRVYAMNDYEYVKAGVGPRADRIADGIRWAARNGADVINVSMSTPNHTPEMDAAVAYATRRGALVVASAGNNESGTGGEPSPAQGRVWPAASPGALGVTAADGNDRVTGYSMHGRHVDVVAPGTNVLTTFHDAGDCFVPGGEDGSPLTSLATPFVSGAAALLMEKYPRESPAEIAYRLQASADRPVRDTRDNERGWGLVRPLEALTMTIDPGRAGPPLPGRHRRGSAGDEQNLPVLSLNPDPLASARSLVAWWLMLGAAVVVLMVILGRWRALAAAREPRRRRRSRESAASIVVSHVGPPAAGG